ncbi:dipicolinate synthase subunit DpsA [Ruminococcus sp.]|uniref:dipicolinate synthase subunit DpsA n=1 Tax=Ruminococcus sp. TaxID=41978 RepID=UPI0025F7993C|nr:dipicolinate synthase subunit DpsA [Ruminococcus sp.]
MNKTVFLCVGGDARQTYTARFLAGFGRVYTYGIDDIGENTIPLASLDMLHEKADVLVLPILKSDGLEISSFRGKKIYCSDVSPHLAKNALVTGGMLRRVQIEYFSSLGFDVKDYYMRDELVIRNCIPTAEGALQIAMQELASTIDGSEVLVIGYGRVGKACAKLFDAVGADTVVTARKLSALAEAQNNGLDAFALSELYGRIARFEVIINTVPAMILDESLLGAVSKNALVIDLASKPGGVDFEAASRLNRRVVWALSLPGKAAPMTGGEIIARAVVNILQERGT